MKGDTNLISSGVSELFEYSVVLFQAKPEVAKDFPQEGTNDHLGAVVGNHNDSSVGIPKCVVAAFASDPLEAGSVNHLAQFPIGDQP